MRYTDIGVQHVLHLLQCAPGMNSEYSVKHTEGA